MRLYPCLVPLAFVALTACSNSNNASTDGGSGGGGACANLCTGGKFSGGTESKFDKVTECQCTGSGTGIAKAACEGYCAPLGISAAKSYLSTETTTNDKCVCDGT